MTEFLSILQNTARLVISAALLFGLWRGLSRTAFPSRTRLGMWLTVGGLYLAWLAVVEWLALNGVFGSSASATPIAIFLPVPLGLPVVLRSARVGEVLDALPWQWLVGLQVYRVLGAVILVAWATGQAPGLFALPAGIGDVLVGLLALPVALSNSRRAAVVWNFLGILDMANAIALSFVSALVAPDAPSIVGAYPEVLIPAFAVPSSILLHALSLRQLGRTKPEAAPDPEASPASWRSMQRRTSASASATLDVGT